MKYCNNCEQHVQPTTYGVGWGILTILTFFGLLGIFIFVWRIFTMGKCPMCASTNWGIKPQSKKKKVKKNGNKK